MEGERERRRTQVTHPNSCETTALGPRKFLPTTFSHRAFTLSLSGRWGCRSTALSRRERVLGRITRRQRVHSAGEKLVLVVRGPFTRAPWRIRVGHLMYSVDRQASVGCNHLFPSPGSSGTCLVTERIPFQASVPSRLFSLPPSVW